MKNFLASQAVESLPSHLKPSKEQAIGMPWILTWKYREDGRRKAKARAVLLGYQDPSYEHRSTTAPVMSRQCSIARLKRACYGLVDTPKIRALPCPALPWRSSSKDWAYRGRGVMPMDMESQGTVEGNHAGTCRRVLVCRY